MSERRTRRLDAPAKSGGHGVSQADENRMKRPWAIWIIPISPNFATLR